MSEQEQSAARPRRLALVALVAAAVAVGGGVAAAVAAVVSRTAPAPAASGQATLYLPLAQGQPAQAQGGAGGAAVDMAGPRAMAPAAPQAALSIAQSQGAYASSLAYPYPGAWCNSGPAASATGPGITATGLAQVTLPASVQTAQTLNVGVQSNGDEDVATALNDAQQRLTAIRNALHSAGVPDSQISQQGLNVYANGAPKPSNVNINGSLTATIADAAVLDRAMRAGVAAGANSINVWSSNGASGATPDEKTLQSAIARATDAAKTMAQSQASAAGVQLGGLQSSQAQPPSVCGWSSTGAQMVVAVTLTYAVK